MRQSAAHSRHQLLPVCDVCAPIGVRRGREGGNQQPTHAASRWCSDATVSNGACGPRSPTQTRPLSSVSALVAAAFGPAVGSAAFRVGPGGSQAACTKTRATTSHLAGPFGPEQLPQHRIPGTSASSVPGPTGVCCARVSAIRQLSRVTSSPMHAADGPHSIGAQQQRAGAHSGDDRACGATQMRPLPCSVASLARSLLLATA